MGRPEDPLSLFESLLDGFLDRKPYERYQRQAILERQYGYNPDISFTIRCPRCRNNSFDVDRCERCNHIGIVGVITVEPDRSYL